MTIENCLEEPLSITNGDGKYLLIAKVLIVRWINKKIRSCSLFDERNQTYIQILLID